MKAKDAGSKFAIGALLALLMLPPALAEGTCAIDEETKAAVEFFVNTMPLREKFELVGETRSQWGTARVERVGAMSRLYVVCGAGSDSSFNRLFDDLCVALLERDQLERFIEKDLGVKLRSLPHDPELKREKDFTHAELAVLARKLVTLPRRVIARMELKRVVRLRQRSIEKRAVADYGPESEKIRLTDLAFIQGEDGGEGTMLHEFGHAYWLGQTAEFRFDYQMIGWKPVDGKWQHRAAYTEFVTKYAASDPAEDFAEAFQMFEKNPKEMKARFPKKYEFMLKRVFGENPRPWKPIQRTSKSATGPS